MAPIQVPYGPKLDTGSQGSASCRLSGFEGSLEPRLLYFLAVLGGSWDLIISSVMSPVIGVISIL